MPFWKVLVIGTSACVCLALAVATFVVPFSETGGQRWLWMGGLFAATLASGALFALFMSYAGNAMDVKGRGAKL